jgi:hypothetical protein
VGLELLVLPLLPLLAGLWALWLWLLLPWAPAMFCALVALLCGGLASLPLLLLPARGVLQPLESLLPAADTSVDGWLLLRPLPEAAACISGGMLRWEWSGTRSSSMLQEGRKQQQQQQGSSSHPEKDNDELSIWFRTGVECEVCMLLLVRMLLLPDISCPSPTCFAAHLCAKKQTDLLQWPFSMSRHSWVRYLLGCSQYCKGQETCGHRHKGQRVGCVKGG